MRRIFSGIQPTGIPHIGNYFGALKQWTSLQHHDCIFSIVDLHALTNPPSDLHRRKLEMMGSLIAIGIDVDESVLYFQSGVREHSELSWILSTLTPLGALNRMTQFKSKGDGNLGLFAYPVLQAADILLFKATHVPVGEDQAQHLELSRTLAKLLSNRTGLAIPMPETLLSESSKINDLRDPLKKMSKSAADPKSRIAITDDFETIKKKLRGAVTDSIDGVTYSPDRPGIRNLVDIYRSCTSMTVEETLSDLGSCSHRVLKDRVAEALESELSPIRERYTALDIDSDRGAARINEIAESGADRARTIASSTMREIRDRLGLS